MLQASASNTPPLTSSEESTPPRTPDARESHDVDWTPPKQEPVTRSRAQGHLDTPLLKTCDADSSTRSTVSGSSGDGAKSCDGGSPVTVASPTGAPLLDAERGAEELDVSAKEIAPTRMLFLSMLCIFQGYAVMVGPCQQKFKSALHVNQVGNKAHMFTQAVDFVHWGKFCMRMGHNVFFGCLSPRKRVLLAMSLLLIGCVIPPVFVFSLGYDWIGTVFLSYGLSGMGIGISECTFLSVITPLGAPTKSWAIQAVPVGFGIINIAGMICTSMGLPVESLYWYVVAWIPVGMYIFHACAPIEREVQVSEYRQATLKHAFGCWRTWLPAMTPCLIAKVLVNFAMENITPVSFYTFNGAYVPLLNPGGTTHLMQHDQYFALLALVTLVGNALSQHIAYKMHFERYVSFVAVMAATCVGGALCCWLVSLKIAIVSLGAVFLAFWVNGTVYGASAIFIDRFIPKEYNLVAYSMWCMIGDLGPILGGAMMDVFHGWICGDHVYPYTCRSKN